MRSSVRGARSRIARFGNARIPTSRPAPVSPVFPLAWTGKCAEAWVGERAFERSASSPLRCKGSSTFARVLACRYKGVSKSEDWRAAVNRVRRGAARKCLNCRAPRLIFGANCQSVNVSQTVDQSESPKLNGFLDWETTVSQSPTMRKAEIPAFREPRFRDSAAPPVRDGESQVAKIVYFSLHLRRWVGFVTRTLARPVPRRTHGLYVPAGSSAAWMCPHVCTRYGPMLGSR